MLDMQQVSKVFRTELVETHALRDFTLRVDEGEFVTITGPSGCGKTTFLNIAGLLETYTDGVYRLDGTDVSLLSDYQRARLRNEKIGFIFQSFNLMPDLNLFDNVDVPLRYRGLKSGERKPLIEQALESVGLAGRQKHLPAQLSGGQQQRVAIARALVGSPRFLLADEPTGNLDSNTAMGVMDLLHEINSQGTTIIMVTHDQELARQSRRNIHILDGRINEENGTDPTVNPAMASA
ncbi:MAG: ABC transporter ATP-binding protein [Pseudohongiellaceae bacterium]